MPRKPDLEDVCVWMDKNFGEEEGRNRRQKDTFWSGRLNTEFLKAVMDSDLNEVNKWLQYGASVHAKCSLSGDGAVHIAASLNDDSILRKLLELGASPSAKNKKGQEPIHVAVWHERVTSVTALWEKDQTIVNSIIRKPEVEEESCGIWDSEACDFENQPKFLIPDNFENGTSPLHIASMKNSKYILELLIYKGAIVEVNTMSTNSTPLDVVGIHEEDPPNAEGAFIISYNTLHLNSKLSHPRVEKWFGDGRCEIVSRKTTALHTAVGFGYLTAIEDLLERQACCGVWDEWKETPFHVAIRDNMIKSLLALLEWHKKNHTLKVDARNHLGWTPLQMASFSGKPDYVAALLQGGADASLTTLLERDFFVGGYWKWSYAKFVYSNENTGADISVGDNAKNEQEFLSLTACCLAVMSRNLECVRILSMDGALKITLENKMNLLHLAAWCNAPETTKFLLDKYKELNVLNYKVNQICEEGTGVNGYGMAPIHFATFHADRTTETIQLLVEKGGCDVKLPAVSKVYGDTTALHFATIQGIWEEIKLLYTYDKAGLNRKYKKRKHDRQILMVPHVAAIFNHPGTLRQFLLCGADLSSISVDGNREFTLAETIEMYVDDYVNYLEDIFDECIDVEHYEHGDPSRVVLKYRILAPGRKVEPQMRVLEALVTDDMVGERQALLLHPLTETFLYLKWQKLKNIFNLVVGFHLLLAMLITALGYIRHVHIQPTEAANDSTHLVTTSLRYLLGFITTIVAVLSSTNIAQTVMIYDLSRLPIIRTVLTLIMIGTSYLVVFYDGSHWWQRGVSALAVLLSWTDLLYLLARYPWSRRYPLGHHYVMFLTVASNFMKITFSFSLLIVAFSLSFLILDYDEDVIDKSGSLMKSFLKTITMATDFDNEYLLTNSSHPAGLVGEVGIHIGRAVYLGFFFIVTIAMVNFMTGVAIDDIAALKREGKARQIFEQLRILCRLERIMNNLIDVQVPLSLEVFLKDSLHRNEAIPWDMAIAVKERVSIIIQKRKEEERAEKKEEENNEKEEKNRYEQREATEEITKVVKDLQTKINYIQQQIRNLDK